MNAKDLIERALKRIEVLEQKVEVLLKQGSRQRLQVLHRLQERIKALEEKS